MLCSYVLDRELQGITLYPGIILLHFPSLRQCQIKQTVYGAKVRNLQAPSRGVQGDLRPWTLGFTTLRSRGQKDTERWLANSGSKFLTLGKKLKWTWPEAVLPSASPLAQGVLTGKGWL